MGHSVSEDSLEAAATTPAITTTAAITAEQDSAANVMPDEPAAAATDVAASAHKAASLAEAATLGAWLRLRREQQDLSLSEVAARLRMSPAQIEALERDDASRLPTGTFLRGLVRNYAKAVGLDAADAIARLEATHSAANQRMNQPSIVLHNQNIKFSATTNHYSTSHVRLILIGVLVLALLAAGAYWWFFINQTQPVSTLSFLTSPAIGQETPAASIDATMSATPVVSGAVAVEALVTAGGVADHRAVSANTANVNAAAASATTLTGPLTTLPAIPAIASVSTIPQTLSSTSRATSAGKLQFSFNGDCWLEITDRDGNSIVSRRYKAGEMEEVSGRYPMSVVIGNAPVTRLVLNGQQLVLAPYTRSSVARLKLPLN